MHEICLWTFRQRQSVNFSQHKLINIFFVACNSACKLWELSKSRKSWRFKNGKNVPKSKVFWTLLKNGSNDFDEIRSGSSAY